MTLFRHHRATLSEAMETVIKVSDIKELVFKLNEDFRYGPPIESKDIKVKFYGFDNRINWNTHIVTHKGNAIGFTDGPLNA